MKSEQVLAVSGLKFKFDFQVNKFRRLLSRKEKNTMGQWARLKTTFFGFISRGFVLKQNKNESIQKAVPILRLNKIKSKISFDKVREICFVFEQNYLELIIIH